jgi:hypothetical protein
MQIQQAVTHAAGHFIFKKLTGPRMSSLLLPHSIPPRHRPSAFIMSLTTEILHGLQWKKSFLKKTLIMYSTWNIAQFSLNPTKQTYEGIRGVTATRKVTEEMRKYCNCQPQLLGLKYPQDYWNPRDVTLTALILYLQHIVHTSANSTCHLLQAS